MKKYLGRLVIILVLVSLVCSTAIADSYYGTVLPKSISVWVSPDDTSKKLFSAQNSRDLVVVGQEGEFYTIDLRSSGFDADGVGYVKRKYLTTNGYRIQLSGGLVDFYIDPWCGLSNGLRNSGTFLVTNETDEWLVIQINENLPGSAFIRKVDVGMYNSDGYPYYGGDGYITAPTNTNRWMVMYDHDGVSVGIRVQPDLDTEKLAIIHSGDVVTVLQNNGEFAYVVYEKPNGQLVYGWVRTRYFIPAEE